MHWLFAVTVGVLFTSGILFGLVQRLRRRDDPAPACTHRSGSPLGHRCEECDNDPDAHARGMYGHGTVIREWL